MFAHVRPLEPVMIADLDTLLTALYVELSDRIVPARGFARRGPGRRRCPDRRPRRPVGLGNMIRVSCGQLRSDVILVGEPAKDLLSADPVAGGIVQFRWLAVGLAGVGWPRERCGRAVL